MVRQIVYLGFLIILVGLGLFLASQVTVSASPPSEVKEWIYEERFSIDPHEYRVYNFTFPSNTTVVVFVHMAQGEYCINLEIVDDENYRKKIAGEPYSYISLSNMPYHMDVIPIKEETVLHVIVSNDPGCTTKMVEMKVGYIKGRAEPVTSETLRLRNWLLSVSLATSALGLIVILYGYVKEPKV